MSYTKYGLVPAVIFSLSGLFGSAQAANYQIDPTHSFVEFRTQHIGFSWLYGRFNTVSGNFQYDPGKPEQSSITIEVDTRTIDTNHAERDKHLRADKYLGVDKNPMAKFVSTDFKGNAEGGTLSGTLTLNGITKPVSLTVNKVGEGKDPWGGYRAGFSGTMKIVIKDFGYTYQLPGADIVELEIGVEGKRQ